MPQNPGLGGASILNPFGAIGAQLQWLGQWLGWAFFIALIFLFGAVLMLLGMIMMLSIMLGPAVGPVAAGIGKGPSGLAIGALKEFGSKSSQREDGQTRAARQQLSAQGGNNRRSDYVAAQRSSSSRAKDLGPRTRTPHHISNSNTPDF
jgi:hypothetical protein